MKTGHLITAVVAAIGWAWGGTANANRHNNVGTWIDTGDPGTALTQGEHVVSTKKVQCPITENSCSLDLTAMDEVCNAGDYYWQIIVMVDGKPVGKGEWVTPVGSNCGGATWIGSVRDVSRGDHTVTLITNTTAPSGDRQGQWAVNYVVLVP